MSSESLLLELLGAFAFAFGAAEVTTGLVTVDGFFLSSSDESEDEEEVSCFFLLVAFAGGAAIGFLTNGVVGVSDATCGGQ